MIDGIKISIIIPVYNVGTTLRKCIDTIKAQPYEDYEVLLVDDGSTDEDTLSVLSDYEGTKNNIRVFHKTNGGCIDARRFGVLRSKGEYITFGDGDDFFADNYVAIIHKAIENPADLYILNNYLNEAGTETFYKEKNLPETGYADMDWVFEQLLHVKMNAVWDKIYKRDLFGEKVDIIPENIIFGDDTYLNNKYLPRVKKVFILDEAVFYHYIDSVTSVCGSNASFKRLNDISVVFDSLESVENLLGATSKRCEAYRDFYYGYYVRTIAALIKNGIQPRNIDNVLGDKKIMKNISPIASRSLKGVAYRMLLKNKWYRLASFICK